MAGVGRRHGRHRRGRSRPHRPRATGQTARGVRGPADAHRQLPRGVQRDRRAVGRRRDRRPAARARRTVVLGLRRRRALRADPDARERPGRGDHKDAVFLSPHKFVGGPQHARRAGGATGTASRNRVPTVPGRRHGRLTSTRSGTATSPTRSHREEGGTPAIVESIRAGLVFALKEAVGTDGHPGAGGALPAARRQALGGRTRTSTSSATSTPSDCPSCPSWCAAPAGRYLHHNFVVALLNDLFGIQARGGCSCAGPYGHRLLGIDLRHARARSNSEITRRLRGHQARLGAGQLQLLHLRHRARLPHRRRRPARPRTATGC